MLQISGRFGFGVQNEAGQRLTEFCQEQTWQNKAHIENIIFQEHKRCSNSTRDDSTHGHHPLVNIKMRLIIFFAASDGEALYSQQKQDLELIVVQIMGFLLQISGLNWRR